jgi:hypothetical protein
MALTLLVPVMASAQTASPDPGIALELADARAERIRDLRYDLRLTIPAQSTEPIEGSTRISLALTTAADPLVIDFATSREHVKSVSANGEDTPVQWTNGHIVVPAAALTSGRNTIEIAFRAGDASLNRNAAFLLDRPPENLVLPEHVQMMLRLTRVALQCDVTRVVTFMLGNAGSGRSYEFLGVSGGHHQISHHQRNPDNLEKLSVIDTWEVEQLAYLLEELGSIDEVDGSKLVDNTAVFFSSEIEDCDTHAHRNLPVIVAGLGGGLPIGTHVRYPGGTPIANLFVTLLNAIDVPTTTFGDAVGPLA